MVLSQGIHIKKYNIKNSDIHDFQTRLLQDTEMSLKHTSYPCQLNENSFEWNLKIQNCLESEKSFYT